MDRVGRSGACGGFCVSEWSRLVAIGCFWPLGGDLRRVWGSLWILGCALTLRRKKPKLVRFGLGVGGWSITNRKQCKLDHSLTSCSRALLVGG